VLTLTVLVVLAVFGAVGFVATTPEDHSRALDTFKRHLQPVLDEIARARVATEPFRAALRLRTPWAIVAPTLIGIHVLVFVRLVLSDLPIGDPAALLAAGASVGPLTTNGEWWRLVTATFVHTGPLHLISDLAGLVLLGKLLERLLGSLTFACVYFAAGAISHVVNVSTDPLVVHAGASGAVFGIYGLLIAVATWGLIDRTGLRIPLVVFKSLAPTAALFLLYTMVTKGIFSAPHVTALVVGATCGFILTREIGERKPAQRPLAITMGAAVLVVVALALPVRGVKDIRPDIVPILGIEESTVSPYKKAVVKFTKGEVKAGVLADLISDTIIPELQAARTQLQALSGVLDQQRPFIDDAEEYLRLREASWRLRIDGLRKGSMQILREADTAERASLQALDRLKRRQFSLAVQS
jgi:membrane associated rhomboid family serine protease